MLVERPWRVESSLTREAVPPGLVVRTTRRVRSIPWGTVGRGGAIYRIELAASAEQHERLLADPVAFGIPDEVTLPACATGFELHLFWPQNRTLNLIVEGDDDPGVLTETMSARLAGRWQSRRARIKAAEEFAGESSAWVARMALELELAICDFCDCVVPPHSPGCAFDKRDGGGGTCTHRAPSAAQ
jgi:hypothetical protein